MKRGKITLKLSPSEIEGEKSEMLMVVLKRNFARKLCAELDIDPLRNKVTILDHSKVGQTFQGEWESEIEYTVERLRAEYPKHFKNNY